jgi:nitrate/TMAO reductase-like tetraheme cytochrome c subunit
MQALSLRNAVMMVILAPFLASNNCLRCHNIRPATMYRNAQWDVIVHHMRLRANISG